ncbi:MAG: Na/Pi cotransporter family protein [Bacillota bacterium]
MKWQIAAGMLGGLGLFLFGIQMMASGMQKIAGDRLRRILEVLTGKPIIGIFTGIVVTVLVQSSSTTTVMLVGFVNAGLMTLPQAVSAIMGANIGTTVTAQMVSFKLEFLALPTIGMGALLNFFGKRRFHRYLGQTMLGFGLLFLGMITMSGAMYPLRESPYFINMLVRFGEQPLLGVLFATLFTALIQSSSGATGIIIALTLQDLLTIQAAIPLILGTNIGTCITALLASMGTSLPARKAALAHVLFNVLGVVVALAFMNIFTELVVDLGGNVARQTANAHTAFNVLNTILVFPFFKYFIKLLNYIVPGEEISIEMGSKYLDRRILKTPAIAIEATRQEVLRMAAIARKMIGEAVDVFVKGDRKKIAQIYQKEDLLDGLETEINLYLQELSQHSLTRHQATVVAGLVSAANDLERIGDHAKNIMDIAETVLEDRLQLSTTARQEVINMHKSIDEMLAKATTALAQDNIRLAREVINQDDVIDEMERLYRKRHINRLNRKECVAATGVIYLDVLSNLERIADHVTNLAEVVTEEF